MPIFIHVAPQGIFSIRLWPSEKSQQRLNKSPELGVEVTDAILGPEIDCSHEMDRLQWCMLSISGLSGPQCQYYGPLFKQLTFNLLTPSLLGPPQSSQHSLLLLALQTPKWDSEGGAVNQKIAAALRVSAPSSGIPPSRTFPTLGPLE